MMDGKKQLENYIIDSTQQTQSYWSQTKNWLTKLLAGISAHGARYAYLEYTRAANHTFFKGSCVFNINTRRVRALNVRYIVLLIHARVGRSFNCTPIQSISSVGCMFAYASYTHKRMLINQTISVVLHSFTNMPSSSNWPPILFSQVLTLVNFTCLNSL